MVYEPGYSRGQFPVRLDDGIWQTCDVIVLDTTERSRSVERSPRKRRKVTHAVEPGKEVMVMGWGRRWAALVARRRARRWRVLLTWQTCRRCGSYSFLPSGFNPVCGGCHSLQ